MNTPGGHKLNGQSSRSSITAFGDGNGLLLLSVPRPLYGQVDDVGFLSIDAVASSAMMARDGIRERQVRHLKKFG